MEKSFSFKVKGMHCASCVVLTESELTDIPEVKSARASLTNNSVVVNADFGNLSETEIKQRLNSVLTQHGYSLENENAQSNKSNKEFALAVPLALLLVILFIALQKIGLGNLISAEQVGYSTAFIIGIVASLSTCMAVVGGLVLSLSGNYAREESRFPHYIFHGGRLIGFFILGGTVGALGGVFQLGSLGTSLLSIIVALIMMLLGLNLLDIFPALRRFSLTAPRSLGREVLKLRSLKNVIAPFLLGALTFFLPCGFTQSMQLYALTTHNFWTGAMIMFAFALGTLPILGLLSFGSSAAKRLQEGSSLLFKTMGILIICFAIFNIINALAALGLIAPVFNL